MGLTPPSGIGAALVTAFDTDTTQSVADWMAEVVSLQGASPPPGRDLIPALHLPRLNGTGTRVVDVIGDSTSLDLAAFCNAVDNSQTMWAALVTTMRRQNPHITLTMNNRAIGGTGWLDPYDTGTVLAGEGKTIPSWFSNLSSTWISYVEADAPDVLFIVFGTNAATDGQIPLIRGLLETIAGWTKVPNVVFVTPKVNNRDGNNEWFGMGSYLRTLCRTNGAGYSTFSDIGYLGLLDLGRNYVSAAYGFDQAIQYMEDVPSAVRSGVPVVHNTAITLAETTGGDFSTTLVFPSMGGTAMYGTGARTILILAGNSVNNRVVITLGSDGTWTPVYQVEGSNSIGGQAGSAVSPAAGNVTIVLSCKAERVTLTINGSTGLNIRAPRYFNTFSPTLTVNFNSQTGSPTLNVTNFYQGICVSTPKTVTPDEAFGVLNGPEGGNGINHVGSRGNALDWAMMDSVDFSAPPFPAVVPTVDPAVAGQVWANSDVLTLSSP